MSKTVARARTGRTSKASVLSSDGQSRIPIVVRNGKRWINRRGVSLFLGVSISTVKNLDVRGEIKGKEFEGAWHYDLDVISKRAKHTPLEVKNEGDEEGEKVDVEPALDESRKAEFEASMFQDFEDGMTPIEVVIKLKTVRIARVEEIYSQWRRLAKLHATLNETPGKPQRDVREKKQARPEPAELRAADQGRKKGMSGGKGASSNAKSTGVGSDAWLSQKLEQRDPEFSNDEILMADEVLRTEIRNAVAGGEIGVDVLSSGVLRILNLDLGDLLVGSHKH